MATQQQFWKWLGALALAGAVLPACQSGKPTAASATPASRDGPSAGPYSSQYDAEFKAVFDLAAKDKWDEAEARANELARKAPDDESVKRLQDWVAKQRQLQRAKHIEDKIREIDAKNSGFNPTVPGLLKEDKDRGLPPRKDVRDAIQQIEATPYIPENFGKKIRQRNQLFDLESPEGRMAKVLDKEISVHLDNVALEAIIFNIGQAEGINFVADKALPAFKQTLSVNLQKVKLGEFLRYVARNLEVQFQVGNDLIWIVDAKDPKKVLEETRVWQMKHGFIMPAQFGPTDVNRVSVTAANITTVTETQKLNKFVNDGAPTTPAIETAIKQFFGGTKYQIDYERNVIVAKGTREQLEVMDLIVEAFDRPVQQVLIEARFVTITEAAFLQLGAIWETGQSIQVNQGDLTGLGTFSPGQTSDSFTAGIQKAWPRVLGGADLRATLTALQQSGEGQTLSAPRLTVVNNLPAMINDGKVQYYYEEYTVKQTVSQYLTSSSLVPSGKPAKITSGVSLFVLASIGGDGKNILLALNPQVNQDVKMEVFTQLRDYISERQPTNNIFDIKLPVYRTQDLATRVVVKSGQTVVMGGVLEREQRTFVESVPILSKIPLLGAAFRKRTEINKPRYLLIFVTATLLSENGELILPPDEPAANAPATRK